MQRSDSINELAAALAKAQGMMGGAKKDEANPFYKSKYADLASVVAAIKEPLAANGLSYCQFVDTDEAGLWIETVLMHSSGQWLSGRLRMPVAKQNDPQALGSAITYGRRYGLQAALGVPSEDDDAEGAMDGVRRTNDKGVALGKGVHKPTDGAMAGLDDAGRARARSLASGLVDAWDAGDLEAAAEIWEAVKDADIKIAAWGELGEFSTQRNKFKAFLVEREKKAKAAA